MKKIIVAIALMLFVLSGCKSTDSGNNNSSNNVQNENNTSTSAEGTSDDIVLSMRTTQNLNPLTNEDSSVDNALKLMFEPLVDIDENFKPKDAIAESWSFLPSGNALTLKIKDNLYWHDGTPITADDVVFSINVMKSSPENAVYKTCGLNISYCKKIDDLNVEIGFSRAYSGNIYYLFFPVISSSYYGNNMESKKLEPMGSSAYGFKSFTPAKELRLIKTDNSFGKSAITEEISIIITPDRNTDLYSFDQGILDIIYADITEMGKYDNTGTRQISEYPTRYLDYVGFNYNRSIFRDKAVRQAVAYALPKKNILESVYLSHAQITDTIVNPSSWLYEDDVEKYDYNVEKAKEVLETGGWVDDDGDGIRERVTNSLNEKLNFKILVNEENDERKQIAYRLAEELRSVGMFATVEAVPFADYQDRLAKNQFDMYIGGVSQNPIPDFTYLLGSGGSMNYSNYSDDEVNSILSQCRNSFDENSMKEAFSNLQKYVASEVAYIPIVYRNSSIFANNRINGDINATETNIFRNAYKWYIKK